MRISDWSSDVCSSDLVAASAALVALSLQFYRYTQQQPGAVPPPQVAAAQPGEPFVSMLQAQGSDARWLVSVDPQKRDLKVVAQGDYSLDAQRERLELWKIGDDRSEEHTLELQSLMRNP